MTLKKVLIGFCVVEIFILGTGRFAPAMDALNLATTKVQTLERTSVLLKEKFTGELLLLDFWASWCGPCKDSLPYYEQLQKRYGPQGLQVIAVSTDGDLKEASEFIVKNKLSLLFLWDQNQVLAKSLGINSIPTALVLDKAGKILYQEIGFLDSSKNKIDAQILKALKKSNSQTPEKK